MIRNIKNTNHSNEVVIEKSLEKRVKKPSLYKVVMLNDDYTPVDFVVYLLKIFFTKKQNEASKIMLEVHNKGAATCGIYTREIAETKILKVINASRINGFPLICTLEKV